MKRKEYYLEMKKINLFEIDKEYYGKLENERAIIINSLNHFLNNMKMFRDDVLLINPEKVKKIDKQFSTYAIDIMKMFDIFGIGENKYIYYDRESIWKEQMMKLEFIHTEIKKIKLTEEKAEYKYIDFINDMMTLIFQDNALAMYMPDYFFFGDVLDPEVVETEEKKKEIKELLDNALKPYY